MALTQLHQGITQEKTANGITTSIVYYGTKQECTAAIANATINGVDVDYGRLESVSLSQLSADIYTFTRKYTTAGYGGILNTVDPPSTVIGVKSYTLDCAMISSPLEQHVNSSFVSDYKWCWNHSLARKYPINSVPASIPSAPGWWSTLGAEDVIPIADQGTYQWFQSFSELPQDDAHQWVTIKHPTMPGVTSYDEAGYTLTMLEHQRKYAEAETIAAAKANKIFSNSQVGSSFTSGNWKCDRATVAWDGEYWIVTLTFTYSARGWNTTLYETYSGSIS